MENVCRHSGATAIVLQDIDALVGNELRPGIARLERRAPPYRQ